VDGSGDEPSKKRVKELPGQGICLLFISKVWTVGRLVVSSFPLRASARLRAGVVHALRARTNRKRTVQPSKVINLYLSLQFLLIKKPRNHCLLWTKSCHGSGFFTECAILNGVLSLTSNRWLVALYIACASTRHHFINHTRACACACVFVFVFVYVCNVLCPLVLVPVGVCVTRVLGQARAYTRTRVHERVSVHGRARVYAFSTLRCAG
jgi:hypothetical protein